MMLFCSIGSRQSPVPEDRLRPFRYPYLTRRVKLKTA